ncbi:transglycosylase SLT domain-containing protein [bacterium]|nr:transglycosylase SLT domain-containing protein [bacterium]
MHLLKLIVAGVLFFCSCSSYPKISPETADLVDYTKAKLLISSDAQKACELFSALAKKEAFVLKDAAYVRSLQTCEVNEQTDWARPVPAWLEKEKQLTYFKNIKTDLEKSLFVEKNASYFTSPEKIQAYQKGLSASDITPEQKNILQTALYSLAPRFMQNPTLKDQFRMVKDYRSIRQFDKTKALLKKIIADPKVSIEDKFQAHKEMFLTYRPLKGSKTNQYVQSAKSWAQFLKPEYLSSPALLQSYLEAQTNYARVVWTENGTDQALKILDTIEKTLKNKISLHDVYWLRARMFEEKKQHDMAVAELEKALLEKSTLWRDKEKILWTLAWSYFKEKKFLESEKHLATLIENTETTPFAKFKYLYWRAESENRREDKTSAQATWQKICDEDLFGYYSLLSHFQLQKPLRTYKIPDFKPKSYLKAEDEKIFDALKQTEEIDLASRLLAINTPDLPSLKTKSGDELASLFYLQSQIKNYKYVFSVFNQLPYDLQKQIFVQIPRILFPEVYIEEIKEAYEKTGVEPELIYSIMRQESSFDPEARSPMDAFGLLQVLPEVAKRVAREIKVPYNNYEDLFDEKKNILIGSNLLKKQIQSFDNKFSLYVASYNASSSAVRNWHKRSMANENDDLMFVEEIPYEETKAYVKLVLRNFIIYKKLKYGDEFKDFPRQLLEVH